MTPYRKTLDDAICTALLAEIADGLKLAPLFVPRMPRTGTPFSVRMSNRGPLGWVSDQAVGYRYQPAHPETGVAWPGIPDLLLDLWAELSDYPYPPQACLVNYYGPGSKMGLHQDRDEEDFSAPVLSVSLGDTARFRLGGSERKGKTESFPLRSGDVMVLAGEQRLAFHGVDKVLNGSSRLLLEYPELFPQGGRINLTLRRVTMPE